MILGLHGLCRSGKDTVADYLVEHHDFNKLSFGAALYDEVAQAFGVTVEELASHEWKTQPQRQLALYNCSDADFVSTVSAIDTHESALGVFGSPRTSRRVLQLWGTEYRRAQDQNYWTSKVRDALLSYRVVRPYPNFVITDVRAHADAPSHGGDIAVEAIMLEDFCRDACEAYTLIEIVRASSVSTGHSTDIRLPQQHIHKMLYNHEGQQQVLFDKVVQHLMEVQK